MKFEIIENNGDGTSSLIKIIQDDEGDELYRQIESMWDNDTGRDLFWSEENKRWEYPKDFFEEDEDE